MGAASIRFNFRSGFSHLNNPFLHPSLEATSSALSQPLLATLLHVMCFSCTSCNSIPRSPTEHSTQNTPGPGAGRSLFFTTEHTLSSPCYTQDFPPLSAIPIALNTNSGVCPRMCQTRSSASEPSQPESLSLLRESWTQLPLCLYQSRTGSAHWAASKRL